MRRRIRTGGNAGESGRVKIGVLSDTHNFLDPKFRKLFAGVGHILHAGDIGFSEIISELERIAPVTAVTGNTDGGLVYFETEIVERLAQKNSSSTTSSTRTRRRTN